MVYGVNLVYMLLVVSCWLFEFMYRVLLRQSAKSTEGIGLGFKVYVPGSA